MIDVKMKHDILCTIKDPSAENCAVCYLIHNVRVDSANIARKYFDGVPSLPQVHVNALCHCIENAEV
jgi:ABC-type hemin transport system ATPase subunit